MQTSVVEHALRRTVCSVFHYSCRLLLVVLSSSTLTAIHPQIFFFASLFAQHSRERSARSFSFINTVSDISLSLAPFIARSLCTV